MNRRPHVKPATREELLIRIGILVYGLTLFAFLINPFVQHNLPSTNVTVTALCLGATLLFMVLCPQWRLRYSTPTLMIIMPFIFLKSSELMGNQFQFTQSILGF